MTIKNHNCGNNTMKQCNILVQTRFTMSKVGLEFQYNKHCVQVASRVAEYQDNLKFGWRESLVPRVPSKK